MGRNVDEKKLSEKNECRRTEISIPMLIGFECFSLWQFGVVYFAGNSFSVTGSTIIPGAVASTAEVIAIGGICSVLSVFFLPQRIGMTARVSLAIALVSTATLFFPLPETLLSAAFLVETFCCIFLFGNCFAITILYFTEKSALLQAAVTLLFPGIFIAALHSGLLTVTFYEFAIVSLLAQGGMLAAWLRVPARIDVNFMDGGRRECADNGKGIPVVLIAGVFALVFFATMIMQMGLNAAESVRFGVSVTYVSSMAGAFFFLYLRKHVNVFTAFSIFTSVTCVGFILFLASRLLPLLTYAACVLIGFSFMMFSLVVCFGLIAFRRYPSRWIIAGFPSFVTGAMLVHSILLETFRSRLELLYTVYALTASILLFVWLQAERYIFPNKIRAKRNAGSVPTAGADGDVITDKTVPPDSGRFAVLSAREREVVELLLQGYSSAQIAEKLSISRNTVDTHRKEVYLKLDIHSRRELFVLADVRMKHDILLSRFP